MKRFFPPFIAETIIFRLKYCATAFSKKIFFPGGTQITEIAYFQFNYYSQSSKCGARSGSSLLSDMAWVRILDTMPYLAVDLPCVVDVWRKERLMRDAEKRRLSIAGIL